MSRCHTAGLLLSLALAAPLAQARPADCLLVIEGRTLMQGRCDFDAGPDGSFRVESKTHIAHLSVDKPGFGTGSWSAKPDNRSSYKDTGTLRRKGACWESKTEKLCAWGPGQGPKAR